MNRIDTTFRALAREGRCGFIAYLTAGDPDPGLTSRLVLALEENGADIVELGVPFSDPLADGVVNQRSSERALRRGVTLRRTLGIAAEVRACSEVPLVIFTYLNPVFRYGAGRFAADAARAGVDGVLILDLPVEEAAPYERRLRARGLACIYLVAPTTSPARIALIARHAEGFIYCVSRTGVTGTQRRLAGDLAARVTAVKRAARTPVAVGFGISTPAQVRAAACAADAVVVGSAIVQEIGGAGGRAEAVRRAAAKVRILSAPLRERRGRTQP